MSLQAVIMAGGEGTRLRPLTCDTPKPMVPVLGKPVLSYSLQLLRRHALTEVGVSLLYLPERVTRAFGNGAKEGVRLHYAREKEPLGTAGSVRLACGGRQAPKEPFVVLSGDGLTDCDLSAALDFHRRKNALATLVLKRVREPLSYGVVVADEEGRVQRFVEKPGWGEVYSDTVNTGIYVLSPEALALIPEKGACDFGQEFFPRLTREGKPVYAFVTDSYWCDIGDEAAYVAAQADFLAGRVKLDAGPLVAETAVVDETARLEGPVFIGAGATVGPHAVLSDGAVIGPGARVGAHARIARSVLWEDARAMDWAKLEGAVMGRAAVAGAGSELREDSALGDGAALGARAVLENGARVWPGKRVDPCVRVRGCLVWGDAARPRIQGGRARCRRPEDACVLAAAWREALGAERAAVGHDGSPQGEALCACAAGALAAQGARSLLLGETASPVLRAAQLLLHAEAGLFFSGDSCVLLTVEGGALPPRALERKAEAIAARQDYAAPFSRAGGEAVPLPEAEALYVGLLAGSVAFAPDGAPPRPRLFAATPAHVALAERVLEAAGLEGRAEVWDGGENGALPSVEPWETGFVLTPTLETARVFDCHGMPDGALQDLLAYSALPREEKSWLCPLDAPAALDALAESAGVTLERIGGDGAQVDAALFKRSPLQYRMRRDGLFNVLSLCALLSARRVTLRGLLEMLPSSGRSTARVPVALPERGKLLRALFESAPGATLDGGLRLPLGNGWVTVSGDSRDTDLVVCGEAASNETAGEICGEITDRLKRLLLEARK